MEGGSTVLTSEGPSFSTGLNGWTKVSSSWASTAGSDAVVEDEVIWSTCGVDDTALAFKVLFISPPTHTCGVLLAHPIDGSPIETVLLSRLKIDTTLSWTGYDSEFFYFFCFRRPLRRGVLFIKGPI